MNQRELNREIAKATGETITEIAAFGFIPLTPIPIEHEPDVQTIDWDELDAEHTVSLTPRRTRTPVVV